MTREEAILILRNEQPHCGGKYRFVEEQRYEAYDMAIKALEFDLDIYLKEHNQVLWDKDASDDAIKALEQQTCGDAVSRNLITQTLNKMDRYVAEEVREETKAYLEEYGVPDFVKWDKGSLPC